MTNGRFDLEVEMAFERRILCGTDLSVSPFGIGGGYWISDKALEWAFENGINFFFWAPWLPTYRPMERFLKRTLRKQRDDVVVATAPYSWLLPGGIERAVSNHLRRLGIEQIDLFLLGWVMRKSQERAIDELARMKEKGLIKHVGFSGHGRKMILGLAQKWPIFDVLMVRYNAAHRGAENDIFSHLNGKGRQGIVVFNALKHGAMLKRPKRWPENRAVPTVEQCYRFALNHPSVDVCLAGVNKLDQVKELLQTIEKGPLSPEDFFFMQEFGDARHG